MSRKQKKKSSLAPTAPAEPLPASTVQAAAPLGGPSAAVVTDEFEPIADTSSMPAWLIVVLIALTYWAMLQLDRYGGGFNENVFSPYASYRQLADLQPKSGAEMLIAKGEAIYNLVCLVCHQSSGLGSPGQYPPLAGSEWVLGSPNRLIRIPLHGLTGPIQVKGQAWTGVSMPGFGMAPPLDSDENVAAVLSYIRHAWGNNAPPITPEQVAAVRAETASRTASWTADELSKLPE